MASIVKAAGYQQPSYAPQTQNNQQNNTMLADIFRRVDRDGNGCIDAHELQASLANGTWQPFNMNACKLLVKMFDSDGDGLLTLTDFIKLWPYVNQWTTVFTMYDRDSNGSIEPSELRTALRDFGYRLSDKFINLLVARFDTTKRSAVLFDDFIHMCIALQMLTGAFRDKDTDRDGVITVDYEEFLTMIFLLDI